MAGMGGEPEQFLHADRHRRPLLGLVIDRHRRAGGRGEMGRRLGVEALAQIPRQQSMTGSDSSSAAIWPRGLVDQNRLQPPGRIAREPFVGEIGPLLAFCPAQELNAVAELQCGLAPRQPVKAEADDALRENMRGVGIGRDRLDLFGQHDSAQPARAPRAQRGRAGIEGHGIAILDLRRRSAPRSRQARSAPPARCGSPPRCRSIPPPPGTARAPAPTPHRHCRRGRWPAQSRPDPPPRLLAMRSG